MVRPKKPNRYRRAVDEGPEFNPAEMERNFRMVVDGVEPDDSNTVLSGRNDNEDAMIAMLDRRGVHAKGMDIRKIVHANMNVKEVRDNDRTYTKPIRA